MLHGLKRYQQQKSKEVKQKKIKLKPIVLFFNEQSLCFSKDWRMQFEMDGYKHDLKLGFMRVQTQGFLFLSLLPHLRRFFPFSH